MMPNLYLCCAYLQIGFEIQNVYFYSSRGKGKSSRLKMGKKSEQTFKSPLRKYGYSEKTTEEIWKWYTCPLKK